MFDTEKFYLVGNNLAIDLVNTRIAVDGKPVDLLQSFDDLVSWAVASSAISAEDARIRLSAWQRQGARILTEAIEFRRALHEMLSGIASSAGIHEPALSALNDMLERDNGHTKVIQTAGGFEKRFQAEKSDPGQILVAAAGSAADLLCFGDLSLIRKCENPECVLFFYDTTKNHKRRWCSMAACGNRAKAKAFYRRKKAA